MMKRCLVLSLVVLAVVFSSFASAQVPDYDPPCEPNIQECGCGGTQTRYTLPFGGCSDWYPCSVSATESVCDDGFDNDCDTQVDCADPDCAAASLCVDADGDGFSALTDCRDSDPDVFPGAEELCNLKDDDCDGTLDEGCTCTPAGTMKACGSPQGLCSVGEQTCQPDGTWSDCTGTPPEAEVCNRLDDDCDGETDEGCECVDREMRPCGTDTGACNPGTETCTDGSWGACLGATTPKEEVCGNDLDDNCDGSVDEGCGGPEPETLPPVPVVASDPAPEPAPAEGIPRSESAEPSNLADRCVDLDGDNTGPGCQINFDCDDTDASIHLGAPEVCNNKDDNCNSRIDEFVVRACGISDAGLCTMGEERCDAGQWFGCTAIMPVEEVCDNRLDDDCDGSIDEDCARRPEGADQLALKQFLDLKFGENAYDLEHYLVRFEETRQFTNIKKSSTVQDGKTTISIGLVPVQGLYDITIFEYVPKSIVDSASKIVFSTEPEIIQDDPLFAWHFAELTEPVELSYEVEGEFADAHERSSTIPVAEDARPIVRPWYFDMIPILFIPLLGLVFIVLLQLAHRKRE